MSGMNALSGITIIGALTTTGLARATGSQLVGFVAIVLAMINVVGGFLVTDRMLRMFKSGRRRKS
jgi:NAD(P) transhydrogenase subunit alpha